MKKDIIKRHFHFFSPDTSHDLLDDNSDSEEVEMETENKVDAAASDHPGAPAHTLDLLPPVDPEEFVETVVDTEKDPTSSMHPNPAMLPDKYTDTLEKDIKSETHLDDDDEAL